MKHIYFLFFIALFSFDTVSAQFCPPEGYINGSGNKITFSYQPSTEFCANRPSSIIVEGRVFEKNASCYDTYQQYDLASGETPLSGGELDNFTVSSGFNNSCTYDSYGTLPVEDFDILNKQFKMSPNPVVNGTEIKLDFGIKSPVKIEIFNVTGKLILSDYANNQSFKTIKVSSFSNGLYMVKISTGAASITRKMVILK